MIIDEKLIISTICETILLVFAIFGAANFEMWKDGYTNHYERCFSYCKEYYTDEKNMDFKIMTSPFSCACIPICSSGVEINNKIQNSSIIFEGDIFGKR